ncbi:gluconokinase [Pseudothermotoga elfii]
MSTYLAGLDIGTSSVKLSLWDLQKEEIILQSTEEYSTFQDNHRKVYQDAQEVYHAVLRQLEKAIRKLNNQTTNSKKSMIVVLDTALHTLLLLDKNMNPISNIIPWIDERADSIAAEIVRTDFARETHKRTGCPVDPVYPFYKLIWFKRNEAELLQNTGKIASIKDFLLFKLTGNFVVDFAVASGTGYYDVKKRQWAEDLLKDLCGIDSEKLPYLVSPYEVLDASQEVKNFLGAQKMNIKFVAGVSDAAASSIGATFRDVNLMTISMGTSAAVRRISSIPFLESKIPSSGIWCYAVDENSYITGLALKNGGCLIEWWAKNFLRSKNYDQIGKLLDEMLDTNCFYPACNNLVFIPTVYGMRSPRWMPNKTGALLGLSATSDIVEATKAVLQGLAFNLRRALETVLNETRDSLGEISGIVATGGLCQMSNWPRFLANVINKPITIRQNRYDAANGSIFLYLRDIPKGLLEKLTKESNIFQASKQLVSKYDAIYSSWLSETNRWERW